MKYWPTIALILTFFLPTPALAQEAGSQAASDRPLHPSRLASESDLVALIQLERLNYERRRGFPVGGHAWVDVLIRYKTDQPIDRLRIEETGLGPDRCYFPDVPLWQELPRYLVFLHRAGRGDFAGHRGGCMLDVLVTAEHRYAVRWPQNGLTLNDDELELVEALEFIGPGATIEGAELTSLRKEALMRDYAMEEAGGTALRYTRGIPLEIFREQIIGNQALTREGRQGVRKK